MITCAARQNTPSDAAGAPEAMSKHALELRGIAIATVVAEEFAHALCDTSSLVLLALDGLTDGHAERVFGVYRSLNALAGCVGGWVSGSCIDYTGDVTLALSLSVLGTALGYAGMFASTTVAQFLFTTAFAMTLGSTAPIFARIVSDFPDGTSTRASCLSSMHAIGGFSTFLVPPLGVLMSSALFPRAPFLAMACACGALFLLSLRYRLRTRAYVTRQRSRAVSHAEALLPVATESDTSQPLSAVWYRFVARCLLTFAAQCNNTAVLLVLKDDFGFNVFESSYAMSLSGLVCGLTSLLASAVFTKGWVQPEVVVRHGAMLMVGSCLARGLSLSYPSYQLALFVSSILLDCACGTSYFPAFDAVLVSTVHKGRVGRVVAFVETCGVAVSITSPWVIVNVLYAHAHTSPFWVGVACATSAWMVEGWFTS